MLPTFVIVAHVLGLASVPSALLTARSSQGAVAWIISLLTFPYLAVPLYWLLGSSRFEGYVSARRGGESRLRLRLRGPLEGIRSFGTKLPDAQGELAALEKMARLPILGGNATSLLLDGRSTFESILAGIQEARESVVVQFYIVRDDGLGRKLKAALVERAQAGVAVFFLYDKIGSYTLPRRYLQELSDAGVQARAFRSTRRGRPTRFQINFRNHRKVVVVDGRVGWVGGFNVGDEYLGRDDDIGPWRDTHLRVEGPAALALQLAFVEDWFWATEEIPALPWEPAEAGDEPVLILPSGPADGFNTAGLLMQLAFHAATERIWIASPYFVPDDAVVEALKLAAFRGVEVRLLIPHSSDSRIVDLACYPAVERVLAAGVRVFRYTEGFLHAKTVLVDDVAAGVGTVNLDYRSFRLNFEITALLFHPEAVAGVAASFENDLTRSREISLEGVQGRRFSARLASRAAYLLAPVL